MEPLTMSKTEREKLEMMCRLDRGEVSRSEAARTLGISVRQIYRVFKRWKSDGDGGVVHHSRGGHSGRGYPLRTRNEVVRLYRSKYSDYGPTLFSEILTEKYGHRIHRETLRRWLLDFGLWKREESGRKRSKHRRARPRRAAFGELLQLDGSFHNWFEGRNPDLPEVTLLVLIDDATGRLLLRFSRGETTQGVFELLKKYCTRYGIPKSIYTDYGSVYYTEGGTTQYGRAMKDLGIEVIYAKSPQAKGRVERANRTLQDRLPKELREANISTIEDANRFLDEVYTSKFNLRFAELIGGFANAHRSTKDVKLDRVFSIEDERVIKSDNTVTIETVRWQIEEPNAEDRYIAPLCGASVETRVYLDGSVHIFDGETELRVTQVNEYCGDQKMLGIPIVRKRVIAKEGFIAKEESTENRNDSS
jgi:transposase